MFEAHSGSNHLLQQIVSRATWDLAFRNRLLSDPAGAIHATFGVTVPPDFRVRFVEKPSDLDALIVLPDMKKPDEELDDDDLDQVAGGGDTDSCTW